MISVWLLFLKLLRATAGVRRSNGIELNKVEETLLNQQQKEQEYISATAPMEHSEMADVNDCKMNLGCRGNQACGFKEEEEDECMDNYFSDCLETRQGNLHEDQVGQENKHRSFECDSSGESNGSKDSQEGYSIMFNHQRESSDIESLPFNNLEDSQKIDQPKIEMETKNSSSIQEEECDISVEMLVSQKEYELEDQMDELGISENTIKSLPQSDSNYLGDSLVVETVLISSDSDAEETKGNMIGLDKADFSIEDQEIEDFPGPLDHDQVEREILEQPECPTECELQDISLDTSVHYSSLTKIAEDDEELGKPTKHSLQRLSCSTSELDKKQPKDFCVIQEMKSENVSTEHLDFSVARKQWKDMEELGKGQMHPPLMRHGFSQGGHNYMYTPVRNIDRPRRDPDVVSLSQGDHQHPQFSPCSVDSGLDDVSYRSPYDEPETPVEREIREALEREASFRRERALTKMSTVDATQARSRPAALPHSKSEPGEKGRMFDTPEDRCRSQRILSARTPTLSITTSLGSSPTYREMTADNVIILEPDSNPSSMWNRGKSGLLFPGTSSIQELPSDMNNVIILETSNVIIRSASEFCLSTACQDQESMFQNNPFFKLRSHSTQSLVDQEIKLVRQRDEELRKQRALLYAKGRYDTVLVSPNQLHNFAYGRSGETPRKSKSSPSSPSKSRKMDRFALSCDQKFPAAPFQRVRRKCALAQKWEAGIFANHQQD